MPRAAQGAGAPKNANPLDTLPEKALLVGLLADCLERCGLHYTAKARPRGEPNESAARRCPPHATCATSLCRTRTESFSGCYVWERLRDRVTHVPHAQVFATESAVATPLSRADLAGQLGVASDGVRLQLQSPPPSPS